ncbi:hypothetical protein DDZ14_07490 [Maritimibacter sp. 55A14]|uniref:hypothetical protein n=1 Tax=Maritimibacter sp. 55A14 TaxID=2174844 RepID=UPI000D61A2D0|nr:hypothetical protein [Maritimibacter sp. 55A14]PWE32925.1 hypothetical protein DDZ14_07490 [Maritimibacter sp. 55A14]
MNIVIVIFGMILGAAGAITALVQGYSFWTALALYSGIGCAAAILGLMATCAFWALHSGDEDACYGPMGEQGLRDH